MEQNQFIRRPFFLGYFLQPTDTNCDPPPTAQLLYTSDEVKDIQERNWGGAIDASLSFLDDQIEGDEVVRIVGSSNGFLLCCIQEYVNMHYIVCNPITRESKTLPEPHKSYNYAPLAFICNGEHVWMDGVTYEIFRAGVPDPRELTTTLELEIFSSLTGEWRESSIISATPFRLIVANLPAFVIGDVVFWRGSGYNLVAYDRAKESVEVLDLPWKEDDMHLGPSEGKIHYARHDEHYFQIWVLEDCRRVGSESGWVMKHRVSFTMIRQENPRIRVQRGYIGIGGFHPWNSQLILLLLSLDAKPYWFDLESCSLKEINGYRRSCCSYFPYEWP